MTTNTQTTLQMTTGARGFDERMLSILNDAGLALMISIGHRTRLFDTMADMPPATGEEIAARAGLSERYVREWLGAMVTGGIIEHHPETGTFVLPAEHAGFLTRRAVPNNLASVTQWISVLGSVEDEVVEAFRHGRGVPYSAYKRFHAVMAEESSQTTVAGLQDRIIPLVPGLREKLQRGIDVLDVGCGSGMAMNCLGEVFPNSRFVGYDLSEDAIAAARADAAHRGLANTRFVVQDVARMEDSERFDLVTAFDSIHDQARPDAVLANIYRSLRPGGLFLMQDIAASTHVDGNINHPMGPFIYTISCMHCMSVSLANGGMGLGAAWGREKALEMLGDAGFTTVKIERLDHDILNYYYLAPRTP